MSTRVPASQAARGFPARRISVHADYFGGQLNLKLFRAQHPEYTVLGPDPLVFEPEAGAHVVLTKFGGVIYWNCPAELTARIRAEVRALPGAHDRCEEVEDEIEVRVGLPRTYVDFDKVLLRDLSIEHVKVISRALAQSVALEYFENRITLALAHAEPIVVRLREEGTLRLGEREIVQSVGFALLMRSNVLANLTLFDDPPEAWESAPLSRLSNRLYDTFDLEERVSAINQKVGYLADLNATLLDLLSNRKSRRLEWIVIVLIFVETMFFVVFELLRRG